MTQIELAKALGVSPANIAFWEWSTTPPRSDILPVMASVFGVTIDRLLVAADSSRSATRPVRPAGEVQRAFDAVKRLPRRQQLKVVEMVYAMVDRLARKAG